MKRISELLFFGNLGQVYIHKTLLSIKSEQNALYVGYCRLYLLFSVEFQVILHLNLAHTGVPTSLFSNTHE